MEASGRVWLNGRNRGQNCKHSLCPKTYIILVWICSDKFNYEIGVIGCNKFQYEIPPVGGEGGKHCTVKDVEIYPCPEAARNEPCKIKRGEFASIGFKYTLDFDPVGDLKSRAYWSTVFADLPFVGMDTDACKVTECPVKKNVEKAYNYTLDISKSFPAQKFDVKWKIWEENAGTEKECCFLFKMKLV